MSIDKYCQKEMVSLHGHCLDNRASVFESHRTTRRAASNNYPNCSTIFDSQGSQNSGGCDVCGLDLCVHQTSPHLADLGTYTCDTDMGFMER